MRSATDTQTAVCAEPFPLAAIATGFAVPEREGDAREHLASALHPTFHCICLSCLDIIKTQRAVSVRVRVIAQYVIV